MNVIRLKTCGSTNSWLSGEAASLPHATVVLAEEQTAGRGQRGNSWESEPGANLTFSLLLKPDGIAARDQFLISEAVALGIADAVAGFAGNHKVSVKWPNDIYVDDSKICGILIENSLRGSKIGHSVVGIGINVNQQRFVSDAPNPVSLSMLTGSFYNLDAVLDKVLAAITLRLEQDPAARHADYMSRLWRRDGADFIDTASGCLFHAVIEDVAPTGHITLRESDGTIRIYAFKEVKTLIGPG